MQKDESGSSKHEGSRMKTLSRHRHESQRVPAAVARRSAFIIHHSAFIIFPRRGFSFIEVLFAVMILGIGFIMIAGIFPVAISQTASSQEETLGTAAVSGAVSAMSQVPQLSTQVPADANVMRLVDPNATTPGLWSQVKGNQILQDRRFAWIPLLKRNTVDYRGQPPQVAQLIVIPVKVRGRTNFDGSDLSQTGSGNTATANLMPWPITVTLSDKGNLGNDEARITGGLGAGAAAPGAVIVVRSGTTAGRLYRLGNAIDPANGTYELLPGNDLFDNSEDVSGADAWIVGQGRVNGQFGGGNMAIGVFSTYIQLNQ